jgi:hypothetical protein
MVLCGVIGHRVLPKTGKLNNRRPERAGERETGSPEMAAHDNEDRDGAAAAYRGRLRWGALGREIFSAVAHAATFLLNIVV